MAGQGDKLAIIQSEETIRELRLISDSTKTLVTDFKNLIKEANKVNQAFNSGRPREYAAAIANLRDVTSQYTTIERQLADSMTRVARLETQQARTATENARTRIEVAAALREESRARQQTEREQRQNARTTAENTDAYRRFSREVLEARNKAKSLGAEMILLEREFANGNINRREYNRQMNQLSREFVEARTRALGLHEQIRRLDASVGDNQRNVGNYRSALNGLTTSFRSLLGAFGVAGAIQMFANLTMSSFETVKKLDSLNYTLKSVFETELQVARQREYITEISNRFGLELISTTEAYAKFSAAVKGSSIEGEKARQIFTSFAGAGAKLGVNAENMAGIFRAVEQMLSKGKISAEELRGQLGDRMSGAFRLFATSLGMTTMQLDKAMQKGAVFSESTLPKVAERLEELYKLNDGSKVDTLAGAQNRLSNAWTQFLTSVAGNKEIINGLATGMEAMGDVLNFLLDTLILKGTDGVSVVGDLIEIIRSLYDSVTGMAVALGVMDEKTKNSFFSLNQFKNQLKSVQGFVAFLTGTIKELVGAYAAFFETIFQTDGWDKFTNRIAEADKKLLKLWGTSLKVEAGIMKANKAGLVYKDESAPYLKAWNEARKAKQAFFQLNGKYFNTSTGRNTGKSLDDYIDDGKVLKKKDKAAEINSSIVADKAVKAEKYKASRLAGVQKDYLKDLQASRDLELALNETAYTRGLKSEIEYLNSSLIINNDYFNKKISYLKGTNAEERKQRADAVLDQIKMQKETQKKIFDIDSKQLDEKYKKETIAFERRSKFFENSEFEDNTGRLESEIALNDQMLESAKGYYTNKIEAAKKANEDTLELERKRDDEIGNLEDSRSKKINSRLQVYVEDLNIQSETIANGKILTFEEQRSLVLSNKKLTNSQREYQLSILEKNNQIDLNKLEIIRLNTLKDNLSSKEFITKEDEKQLSEYTAQIKALENINIEINIDIKNDVSDKIKAIQDTISTGFRNIGFENLGDAYAATMERLKGETASWKDYSVLAATAVLEAMSNLTNRQKEQRLSALDEELKQSQENTEQEISFIDGRLEQLNALQNLTEEQMTERNKLEDEARTYKEQQQQREKMIAAQKAKAEQRAAAQQALINGALAATMTLAQLGFAAGAIPAALALAFGVAQSVAISSKDPVPQYFVGTSNARQGWALTQERGAEIHTDKNDNIKSLGSNRGAQKTWMEAGDKVYTASETSSLLKKIGGMPKIGENIFQKIALSSLKAPEVPILINNSNIDYDKLGSLIAEKYEKIVKAYDKPSTEKIGGKIIRKVGRSLPVVMGTYDLETLKETYYKNDSN
jgi:tape measure domain-containing protein